MYWPMMYPEKEFKQTWVITVPEHHSVKLSVMTISLCYNGHQDKCSLNSSSADQLIISNGKQIIPLGSGQTLAEGERG